MNEKQIIDILSNSEIFKLVSFPNYVLRAIGWGIIKSLAFLSNSIEKVVNSIYSLNGFFSSSQVDSLIHSLFPIAWGILAIAILFLGFKIMFNRDFKLNGLVKNCIISVSIVMLLPLGMSQLSKITNSAISGLKSEYKLSADKIIKDNIYDLYYLDSLNFKTKNKNNMPANLVNYIDINEEIDEGIVKNKEVFKSKISADKNGKKVKLDLKKGLFNMFPENYYRYNFKFWTMCISLGCTTITLLCTAIKISRIIFELGFVKLFGILYSFSDISTGQKNKEIIRCIVTNFVILFIISVLLKMYLLFSAWTTESSQGIAQLVLLIGGSIAVIDGPNVVERILGIDSGVKSGWSLFTGAYAGASILSKTSQGISKAMESAVSGIASVGSGAVGMYNGFKEGMKPLEEQMNDKPLSNLDGFGKDDKDNKSDLKEQTSLHDEMKSQSNNDNEFTDASQSPNIQGDSEELNSSTGNINDNSNLNSSSDNDIDNNLEAKDNKNNNLDMKQDAENNLSSNIDVNNISSKTSNPTLDSEINKSNTGNYQGSYSSQSNASGDKGNVKSDKNISASENNKIDNSVGNNSLENEMANITDASKNNSTLESEMGSIADTPIDNILGSEMGSMTDAPIDNTLGSEMGSMTDAPIDNTLGSEIGSIADAPIDNTLGSEMGSMTDAPIDNTLGSEIGSIADAPIDNTLGSEIGSIADAPIDNTLGSEIGSIADTPIDNTLGSEMGSITDAPIDNTLGSKIGSITDAPIDNTARSTEKPIDTSINNSSIERDINTSNSNTDTVNKAPNVSTNSNTYVPNQVEKIKSPVEHRTLSEHLKYNMQTNPTFRNVKQSYSIGKNTGMKMANLIKNRKNKKDKN
ncbi:pLS20_p028 family conjugation system transmembrane protein (plasmid) [Paraclostridium tenue]